MAGPASSASLGAMQVPPLENVLLTRWPAAAIDWNGHEVIL